MFAQKSVADITHSHGESRQDTARVLDLNAVGVQARKKAYTEEIRRSHAHISIITCVAPLLAAMAHGA
jgi:hypothetical protein